MSHTLATGSTAQNKYPSLGKVAGNSQYPLGKTFGLLVGESGAGKSFVMQSNPDAYILNLDETPSVCPNSEAVMFPVAGPDGRPVDESGNPIVLTWDHIEEKKKTLCQLATSNQPRPKTVVLDTIMQALRLLRPHVAKMYGRETFREVDGRLGWERLFDTLIEFAVTLRQHGYGVIFTCHLSRKHIPISDNQHVEEYRIMLSDGLYARLFPMFDVVIPVIAEWKVEEVEVEKEVTINGKTIKRKVKHTEKIRKHTAAFENEKLEGITKTRTLSPLTQVELPSVNAWDALENAFDKANTAR
jgi:hypothetical protein